MSNFVHSPVGLLHLAAACLAMPLGALVLYLPKGSTWHKRIGYAYCASMLILNATAFMIYHLWGKFGVFHWFAILSTCTLLAGMLPLYWVQNRPKALGLHLSFMYWSVIGLYCAFVAETLVRIPHEIFRGNFALAINVSIFSLMTLGNVLFGHYKKRWAAQLGLN